MNAEFWARTEDLLDEALDLLPHERVAFLDDVCADTPEIRQEVETLIAAAENGVDLLPALQMRPPGELPPGTLVQDGRYRVAARIGRGGMGEVYKAYDHRLACDVALKRLLFRDASARHAFERDPLLLARLKHPCLPTVIDNFTEDGDAYFVMEYVPGRDLSALLKERGRPFDPGAVRDWAEQLLDTLHYLHTYQPPDETTRGAEHRPILHRDVKPGNLKLHPSGKLYLLDFGISRSGSLDLTRHAGPSVGLTPHYAPPEQFDPQAEETPRSDLYAWGATIYTLLTGERPPKAETRAAVVADGYPDPLVPAHRVRPTVPFGFSNVVHQAMALDPDERPPDAAAVLAALRKPRAPVAAVAIPPVVPPAPVPNPVAASPPADERAAPTLLLTGLALVFLVALGFVFYAARSEEAPAAASAEQAASAGVPQSVGDLPDDPAQDEPGPPGETVKPEPSELDALDALDALDESEADADGAVDPTGVAAGPVADADAPDDERAEEPASAAPDAASEARVGDPSGAVPTVRASFAFRDTADPSALLTRGYIEVDGRALDGLAGQTLEAGRRCFGVRRDGYALVGAQVGDALVSGRAGRVCLDVPAEAASIRIVFYMRRN